MLQGFTLQNGSGYFDMTLFQTVGGGVRIVGASPTIRDCLVQQNEADLGSGLYSEDGTPRIEDCVLADNTPSLSNPSGGGAWFSGGSPWIGWTPWSRATAWRAGAAACTSRTRCRACCGRRSATTTPWYAEGGGVYLLACPRVSFVDCTLSGNDRSDGGWGRSARTPRRSR